MATHGGKGRTRGKDGGRPPATAAAGKENEAVTSNIAVSPTTLVPAQVGSEAGAEKSQHAGSSDDYSAGSLDSILNKDSAHSGGEGEKGDCSATPSGCRSSSVTSFGTSTASDGAEGSDADDAVGGKGIWNDDWDPQDEGNRKVASIYALFKPCMCTGMGMPEVP